MRKRIITALLAAAMMMTALSGCFEYVEEDPESSSETNVTTSAQSKSSSSKTATTSAAPTTTSQAATTSKKPTTTAKKDPTTAKFKYSLIKRLKSSSNGNGTGNNGGGNNGGGNSGDNTSDTPTTNNFYDNYRQYTDVADLVMAAAKRPKNPKDPLSGGLWNGDGKNENNLIINMDKNDPKGGFTDTTLWPYGAYMEAVGAQVAYEGEQAYYSKQEYQKLLDKVLRFTHPDFNNPNSLGLACVQGRAEIYNDDDVWIALEWMNAYNLLKEPKYKTLASRTLNFIWESWDTSFQDGGIWWMRAETNTGTGAKAPQKNACINAPYAWAATEMYQISGDQSYLNNAKMAYDWVKTKLWNKDRNLIEDKWYLEQGEAKRDTNMFAYNTGCMIGAGALLYEETKDETYLNDAYDLAKGSSKGFFSERMRIRSNSPDAPADATGHYFAFVSPQGDSDRCWFRSNLVKGIYTLYEVDKKVNGQAQDDSYARIALNAVAVGAVNAGRSGDFINPDFNNVDGPTLKNINPTSQGGAARMLYNSAEMKKNNPELSRAK